VALAFEVLAEVNRRRILDLLRAGERPVAELVERLGVSQPAVSKHLRILREAGFVEVRSLAQHRLYRVRVEPLRTIDEWLEPYRRLWESRLDDLERHLDAMPEAEESEPRRSVMSDGELEQVDRRWRLRFTRRLPHPPEKVWRALTEREHLAAWFPTDVDGERSAGAPLRFDFRNGEGPAMEGEMLAYDPPSVLELRWGQDTLRFELRADGDGTELTFLDTFEELGRAARDAAGWHVCLDALASHLDGDPQARRQMDRWQEVHEAYVQRLGPEAATIGPPAGAGGQP
jgi:DNA-binding transcriptional ArsR family regulator/uncharacterized protein YndB with AHSA1/START domain